MNDDQRWRDPHEWDDDEPIGVVYSEKRHRWAHAWSEYLVIMIGLFGVIAVLGAARPFSAPRMAGALCILAALVRHLAVGPRAQDLRPQRADLGRRVRRTRRRRRRSSSSSPW